MVGEHRPRLVATKDFGDTMSVRSLIAALQALPQDMPVLIEGCDCLGPVLSVGVEADTVVICRDVYPTIAISRL